MHSLNYDYSSLPDDNEDPSMASRNLKRLLLSMKLTSTCGLFFLGISWAISAQRPNPDRYPFVFNFWGIPMILLKLFAFCAGIMALLAPFNASSVASLFLPNVRQRSLISEFHRSSIIDIWGRVSLRPSGGLIRAPEEEPPQATQDDSGQFTTADLPSTWTPLDDLKSGIEEKIKLLVNIVLFGVNSITYRNNFTNAMKGTKSSSIFDTTIEPLISWIEASVISLLILRVLITGIRLSLMRRRPGLSNDLKCAQICMAFCSQIKDGSRFSCLSFLGLLDAGRMIASIPQAWRHGSTDSKGAAIGGVIGQTIHLAILVGVGACALLVKLRMIRVVVETEVEAWSPLYYVKFVSFANNIVHIVNLDRAEDTLLAKAVSDCVDRATNPSNLSGQGTRYAAWKELISEALFARGGMMHCIIVLNSLQPSRLASLLFYPQNIKVGDRIVAAWNCAVPKGSVGIVESLAPRVQVRWLTNSDGRSLIVPSFIVFENIPESQQEHGMNGTYRLYGINDIRPDLSTKMHEALQRHFPCYVLHQPFQAGRKQFLWCLVPFFGEDAKLFVSGERHADPEAWGWGLYKLNDLGVLITSARIWTSVNPFYFSPVGTDWHDRKGPCRQVRCRAGVGEEPLRRYASLPQLKMQTNAV